MAQWSNWIGNQRWRPQRMLTPQSAQDVCEAVKEAARDGLTIHMVGSGHAASDASGSDGVILLPGGMNNIISLDKEAQIVVVEPGMTLGTLKRSLAKSDLAINDTGDLDLQTVAGSIQTSTHGSDKNIMGLASRVIQFELVDGTGEIRVCSREVNTKLFYSALCGFGAFGIIVSFTIRVEPAYFIEKVEKTCELDEFLKVLPEMRAQNQAVSFVWFPFSNTAGVVLTNRTSVNDRPVPAVASAVANLVMAYIIGPWLWLSARYPSLNPSFNRFLASVFPNQTTTAAPDVPMVISSKFHFINSEYGFNPSDLETVLEKVREILNGPERHVSIPVSMRYSPAEEIWLSPAYGRETVWMAFGIPCAKGHERTVARMESLLKEFEARPHWGKFHMLGYDYVHTVYPRFSEAAAIRQEVDPKGVFATDYVKRVFGL